MKQPQDFWMVTAAVVIPVGLNEAQSVFSFMSFTKTLHVILPFLPLITFPRGSSKALRISIIILAFLFAFILLQSLSRATGFNISDELFRVVIFMLLVVTVALLAERIEKVRSLSKLNRELEVQKLKLEEANRELEKQKIKLEDVNRELEAFAYSVSHDLRAPLRAIDGFSRIIIEDYEEKLDDEGVRLLNVIRDNTRKMGQLIDDILRLSRVGRQEMKMSRVDLKALSESIFSELIKSEGDRKIEFKVNEMPPVCADRALIYQVMSNLLSNAIKFTRRKNPAIIEVGYMDNGGEHIYYVKDNGAGFNMKYAEKLFGLFQRLHSSDEFEGTGVGLSIVNRIIRRHGGRVWGEGVVGEGATIYFTLPGVIED